MKRRLPSQVMRISCGSRWAIVAKSKTAVAVPARIQQVSLSSVIPAVYAFLRIIGNQFHIDGPGWVRKRDRVQDFLFLKSRHARCRGFEISGDSMQGGGRTDEVAGDHQIDFGRTEMPCGLNPSIGGSSGDSRTSASSIKLATRPG